jgi:hypothetical protein
MGSFESDRVSLVDRTELEKTAYFRLSEQRKKALEQFGDDHYWASFDITWGKRGNGKQNWVLSCKHCKASLSTENVSSAVKKHMTSFRKCPASNEKWREHEESVGKKKRPITEADMEEVAHLRKKRSTNLILDMRHQNKLIKRHVENLMTWILMNPVSFRLVDDPLLAESLKMLRWPSGICRNTHCGSFLDTKYEEFLAARESNINYFKCFQVASDSWRSKYANKGSKLVGATLNFPTGSHLGDIFTTVDDEVVSRSYLFNKMTTMIDALGSDCYIGCVFDGEMAYRKAGEDLQAKYPGTIHMTCQAHTLSLLLKDISKIDTLEDCFSISHKMVLLCNVRECRPILQECQKEMYQKTYPLRLGVETRFGYFVTEMRDLIQSKEAIKKMAGNERLLSKFNPDNTYSSTEDQRLAFSKIFSDSFWSNLATLVDILGPVVDMIHHIEQDKPMITQMYFVWRFLDHKFRVRELPAFEGGGSICFNGGKTQETIFGVEKDMAVRVRKRMEYTNVDLFTLAFLLDLRFFERIAIDTFRPPVKYVTRAQLEKAKVAFKSFILESDKNEGLKELERLLEDGIQISNYDHVESLVELIESSKMPQENEWKLEEGGRGNFIVASLWRAIDHPRYRIISDYVTRNLFAMHVTSCSCERLWSRMRHLYKPTRHRLDPQRAKKLLMITMGRDFKRSQRALANYLEGKTCQGDEDVDFIDLDLDVADLDWLNDADIDFMVSEEIVDLAENQDSGSECEIIQSVVMELGQLNNSSTSITGVVETLKSRNIGVSRENVIQILKQLESADKITMEEEDFYLTTPHDG